MLARRVFGRVIPISSKILISARILNLQSQNASSYIAQYTYTHNVLARRLYAQEAKPEEMTADYDYVKRATTNSDVLIVDVREPDEVKEHGKIPNSINIPLGNVASVLSTMSEKEFQHIYKRSKPNENSEIIFYCMIGKRSGMAQQNAVNIGYKNVKNYLGSWTDWASKKQ